MEGQRILAFVSNFDIEGNGAVPVTAARRFASENRIKAPAVINVKRNHYTTDHFFLAEKGMFGIAYVEFNWMLFPCLNKLVSQLGYKQLFDGMEMYDWASEEESYKDEYAFI